MVIQTYAWEVTALGLIRYARRFARIWIPGGSEDDRCR